MAQYQATPRTADEQARAEVTFVPYVAEALTARVTLAGG